MPCSNAYCQLSETPNAPQLCLPSRYVFQQSAVFSHSRNMSLDNPSCALLFVNTAPSMESDYGSEEGASSKGLRQTKGALGGFGGPRRESPLSSLIRIMVYIDWIRHSVFSSVGHFL